MDIPPIYVLRHGETVWNAEGRLQGAFNSPLTERGIAQAKAQGDLLADLDLSDFDIFVSPQGRAFQTAAIALSRQAALLTTDARLREIGLGEWAGQLRAELPDLHAPSDVEAYGAYAFYQAAPGGEGFEALADRATSFLGDLRRPTICVTHGITSRMLRLVAMGERLEALPDLPGGQGVVHCVEAGRHFSLGTPDE